MAYVTTTTVIGPCRRAVCPTCEPSTSAAAPSGSVPPSVDGSEILIRQGDVIDVGIDWSAWLAANGGVLSGSSWAADASSPKTPTIDSDGYDVPRGQSVAIIDATAATVGDRYVINNTVLVDAVANTGGFAMPQRTLKRCIHVRVTL